MVHINLIVINTLLTNHVACLHFNIFYCLISITSLHHSAVPVVASWLHCREQSLSSCLLYQAKRLACWRLMGLLKVVIFGFYRWWALADRLLSRSMSLLVLEKTGGYHFFYIHQYDFINCMLFLYLFFSLFVYITMANVFFHLTLYMRFFFYNNAVQNSATQIIDLSEKKKFPSGYKNM